MSAEDKSVELVQQLIQATEAGRVVWHPTARIDEFTSSLEGRFSILVAKEPEGESSLRMLDEDGRELLQVSSAQIVKTPVSPTRGGGKMTFDSVAQLFNLARRNALHVDQAIDDVLQGLKRP